MTHAEKVKKAANDIYEHYERDYTDFTNSKLRSVSYCERKILETENQEEKLFFLDVKTELNNGNY